MGVWGVCLAAPGVAPLEAPGTQAAPPGAMSGASRAPPVSLGRTMVGREAHKVRVWHGRAVPLGECSWGFGFLGVWMCWRLRRGSGRVGWLCLRTVWMVLGSPQGRSWLRRGVGPGRVRGRVATCAPDLDTGPFAAVGRLRGDPGGLARWLRVRCFWGRDGGWGIGRSGGGGGKDVMTTPRKWSLLTPTSIELFTVLKRAIVSSN